MKRNILITIFAAALVMTACGKAPTPAIETPAVETPAAETPVVETPVVETPVVEAPVVEAPAVEEDWKKELAESLFENYGVLPEYYEDLGNGIYQVYVEVGGKIVPFVTVDSATGDYHG